MTRQTHVMLCLALGLAAPGSLAAQGSDAPDPLARNTISFELMGHGGTYSLNYERLLGPGLAVRVGLSHYDVTGGTVTLDGVEEYRPEDGASVTLVPVTASRLRGGTHHLELGGGALLGHARLRLRELGSEGVFLWGVAGLVGYRYQPPGGGFFFRAAYTPLWSGGELSPLWFGLSFGYTL